MRNGLLQNAMRHTTKAASTLVVGALGCLLPGCQSIAGNSTLSQIRIIDAAPAAPGLDIYEGTTAIAYNLGFGTITSYVPVNPGRYTISANQAGTTNKMVSATAQITTAQQYSVLISNVAASLQALVLTDQSSPAPTGEVAFRIVDEAMQVGAVDIYLVPSGAKLADVNPFITNVTFSTVNGYLDMPVGNYAVVIVATGTSTVLYTGNSVNYVAGAVRTFILLDQQVLNKPAANVITAVDYDPPSALLQAGQGQ